jgi:hypothetical protein
MSSNDPLGVGNVLPIKKLLDIVSKAIGKLSQPYFDRKKVEAKRLEIEKISKAINENYRLTGGIEYKGGEITIFSPKDSSASFKLSNTPDAPLEKRTKVELIIKTRDVS